MPLIQIKQFIRSDSRPDVDVWYERQSKKVRAEFDVAIRYLRDQPREKWERPKAAKLERDGLGLYEVRFSSGDIQYRPLGFFGPKIDDTEFTIVMCNVIEKMHVFFPLGACKTALKHSKAVINNPNRTSNWIMRDENPFGIYR